MIQPQELRIGNLLQDKVSKTLLEVIELNKEDITTYVIDRSKFPLKEGWGLEPIELTEEWLVKFSFEFYGKVITNEYEYYRRYVLYNAVGGTSNYEIHIINSCYGGQEHLEICYSIDNDERQRVHNTKYVHTLQNHFYTATGQELTIKE